MSRMQRMAAWTVSTLTLAGIAIASVLIVVSWQVPAPESLFSLRGASAVNAALMLGLGLLVVTRRPANRVGWVILMIAPVWSAHELAAEYGIYALGTGQDPAGGALAAWVAEWMWAPTVAAGTVLALLFPSGTLLSRRWRWAVAFAVVVSALQVIALAFQAGELRYVSYRTPNPFAVDAMASQLETLEAVTNPLSAVVVALAALSLVMRYARSGYEVRLQLKWLVASAVFVAVSYALVNIAFPGVDALEVLMTLAIMAVAGAVAVAILRYRLYDIDILIRRTLIYASVSAVLGLAYVAAVVLVGTLLRPFTAGSDFAVAVSTLLVVALFQPIRRRVQDLADRRFYRARYDAARTLDAFTAQLRNEVDIDSVRADLLGAVGETVRPAHATIWLRDRSA